MRKIRAMMIGAHPDDCDLRCGGLAMKYADAGHTVKFLSLCDGSGGHQSMKRAEIAKRRYGEAQEVARKAGITYDIWGVPDCEIVADIASRKRLTRDIRAFAPDVIFCHRPNDYHADHRNASLLVQDASYLLIVPNFCEDAPALEKMPVIVYFYDRFTNPPFSPDVIIATDDVVDRKFDLYDCHKSQFYEWLPYTAGKLGEVPADDAARREWLHGIRVPRDGTLLTPETLETMRTGSSCEAREAIQAALYREKLIARYGKPYVFAESFEICPYGSQPDADALKELFPF